MISYADKYTLLKLIFLIISWPYKLFYKIIQYISVCTTLFTVKISFVKKFCLQPFDRNGSINLVNEKKNYTTYSNEKNKNKNILDLDVSKNVKIEFYKINK